jgi:hypothetical protein
MSKKAFLASHSSREVAEYMAVENIIGPFGPSYEREMLAQIVEMLQSINYNAVQLQLDKDSENPVPEPRHVPRPYELLDEAKKQHAREASMAPEVSLSDDEEI